MMNFCLVVLSVLIFPTLLLSQKYQKVFGEANLMTWGNYLSQASNGDLLMSGIYGEDGQILRTDIDGNKIWNRTYSNGSGGGQRDEIFMVDETDDGNIIACGYSFSPDTGFGFNDCFIVKVDGQNGDQIYAKMFGGWAGEYLYYLTVSGNDVLVAGVSTSFSQDSSGNAIVIKVDEATGNMIWGKSYGIYAGLKSHENIWNIHPCGNNEFIVAGTSVAFPPVSYTYFLMKIDDNGNVIWAKTYDNGYRVRCTSVYPASDGGFVMAGYSTDDLTFWDLLVIKTDQMGNVEWSSSFEGFYDWDGDWGIAVVEAEDGGFTVAAETWLSTIGGSVSDALLLKTNSDGSLDWAKNYGFGAPSWEDGFHGMIKTCDGYIATGWYSEIIGSTWDACLVRVDNDGNSGCMEKSQNPAVTNPVITVKDVTADMVVENVTGVIDLQDIASDANSVDSTFCITPCAAPMAPSFLQATDTLCINTQDELFAVNPILCAEAYDWTVSADALLSSIGVGDSILADFAVLNNQICVAAINFCDTGAYTCVPVVVDSVAITVTGDTAFCADETNLLNLNIFSGTQPFTILWSNDSISTTNTVSEPGTYSVLVTDNIGCIDSFSIFVDTIPLPSTSLNQLSQLNCFGDSDAVASLLPAPGSPPYDYVWTSIGSTNATVSGLSAGVYNVVITDTNGCDILTSITITEPDELIATLDSQAAKCDINNGILTVLASGGSGTLNYIWNDSLNQTTPIINNLPPGVYSVMITDQNNCQLIDSAGIIMASNVPVVQAWPDSTIYLGQSVQVYSSGGDSCEWVPSTGLSDENNCNPLAKPEQTTTYVVTVTENGCENTDTITITVNDQDFILYIPNSFTPNGDGLNDFFEIKGRIAKSYQLQIYDRWGQLMFTSDDIQKSWDGTGRQAIGDNQAVPEDTYVYYMTMEKFTSENQKYVGRVSIIR